MRFLLFAALALLLAGCDASPTGPGGTDPGVPERYTVVPIEASVYLLPTALNSRGEAAVDNSYYGRYVGVWSDTGVTLHTPQQAGRAYGLNDAGQLVGVAAERPFVAERGHIWYLAGPGLEQGAARAINDAGTIVGSAVGPEGERAFVLSNAQVTFLDVPGDTASEAVAVNGRGHVAVNSSRTVRNGMHVYSVTRAHLWRDGALVGLGHLVWPAAEPGWVADTREFSHVALDLNERDEVVGDSRGFMCTPDRNACRSRWRAFLWRKGKMIDLGTAHDDRNSSAVAINRWGHVLLNVHQTGVFLWSEGKVHDLNQAIAGSGWTLERMVDVNDRGQLLAWARKSGESGLRGVRLDPA